MSLLESTDRYGWGPAQPCSSCILRNTERFCYTSEMEDDSMIKAPNPVKRNEKAGSSSSTAESPPSSSVKGQSRGRSSKKARLDSDDSVKKEAGSSEAPPPSVDTQAILKTIESMKSAIRSLQQTIGVKDEEIKSDSISLPEMVDWVDAASLLPSKEDCEMIFDCFFSDAYWQTANVNESSFRKQWQKLQSGAKIQRTYIALVCVVVSHALLLAPGYDPTSRLSIQPESRTYCELALRIVQQSDRGPFDEFVTGIEDLQVCCLAFTYMTVAGWTEQAWVEVGKGVRTCKVLHLFDESKWPVRELSAWDIELRRRLAWDCIATDRWVSLHYLRFSDLPTKLNVLKPTLYSDDCYDSETGHFVAKSPTFSRHRSYGIGKEMLASSAEKIRIFLFDFLQHTPSERYRLARDLDAYLQNIEDNELPANLKFELVCDINRLATSDDAQTAAQSLICYTTLKRLRCTVMRQFLLDHEAPLDLRMAALEHARSIIQTTSIVVTLSSSPWVCFSSTWCSSHLFCAASTFAIVYLGETEQDLQDLNWFATKIFEVIEALSFLGAKDRIAKRCEQLLTALCTGKDWLRERFLASRSGKISVHQRKQQGDSLETQSDLGYMKSLKEAQRGKFTGLDSILNGDNPGPLPLPLNGNSTVFEFPADSAKVIQAPSRKDSQPSIPHTSSPVTFTSSELRDGTNQASTRATYNLATAEAWENWPLLNDQQWSSLLASLERDMNALPGNTVRI
ncbi:hypothetical protein CBS101457_004214 [Exobasidium rhododendri]|nr:hypothetical protein CBS101457_004214 [Exobasidium rhododendri]